MSVMSRIRCDVFQLQQPKFMFPIRKKKKKNCSTLEKDYL